MCLRGESSGSEQRGIAQYVDPENLNESIVADAIVMVLPVIDPDTVQRIIPPRELAPVKEPQQMK
jgi:hypothetical protein